MNIVHYSINGDFTETINENTWSLIRKSNTEDIIRISTESNDRELLVKIQKEMIEMVENCYEEIK